MESLTYEAKLRIESNQYGDVLVPILSKDKFGLNVAVLKGRTLLTYLMEQELLTSTLVKPVGSKDQFLVFFPAMTGTPVVNPDTFRDPVVAGVMPVVFNRPVWHQPGILILRDQEGVRKAYNGFVQSSQSWLDKHPSERGIIRDNLPARLKMAASAA